MASPAAEAILALHNNSRCYKRFSEFNPELISLLRQGKLLDQAVEAVRTLGILEPLSGEHIQPDDLQVERPNYRESIIGNGLLSRNRAVLRVLEQRYESLETLGCLDIYLAEALTGFALWLQRHLGGGRLICSEYLDNAEESFENIANEDLCNLSFEDASFDLVVCNELFEHIADLQQAFREIARVLRPGGRLVATCPMAFGQEATIVKVKQNPDTGDIEVPEDAEFHGDPIRPHTGSLVHRIPGWDLLEGLKSAGLTEALIHHEVAWKHGVIGSDLPGVLVIEATR